MSSNNQLIFVFTDGSIAESTTIKPSIEDFVTYALSCALPAQSSFAMLIAVSSVSLHTKILAYADMHLSCDGVFDIYLEDYLSEPSRPSKVCVKQFSVGYGKLPSVDLVSSIVSSLDYLDCSFDTVKEDCLCPEL